MKINNRISPLSANKKELVRLVSSLGSFVVVLQTCFVVFTSSFIVPVNMKELIMNSR